MRIAPGLSDVEVTMTTKINQSADSRPNKVKQVSKNGAPEPVVSMTRELGLEVCRFLKGSSKRPRSSGERPWRCWQICKTHYRITWDDAIRAHDETFVDGGALGILNERLSIWPCCLFVEVDMIRW